MQEKKNTVGEKKEATAAKNKPKNTKSSAKTAKTKNIKSKTAEKNYLKEQRKEKAAARKEAIKAKNSERKMLKEKKLAEREQINAEKRIELAKIKAEKKATKQKIKAQRKKEREKHRYEVKKLYAEKKAARKERKATLKNETKQEKIKRVKMERQEKLRLKREKAIKKAELKKEKQSAKNARKMHRTQNKTRGYGGWLASVISLGVTVLVLSSVLTLTMFVPTERDMGLNNAYGRSYYDSVARIDNIDLGLSKIFATKDESTLQKYFVDIAVNSEVAENDLSELPLRDEVKFYTTKLINQIGDYSKFLHNKLAEGTKITAAEWSNLTKLYEANKELQKSLKDISAKMGDKYDFTKLLEEGKNDVFINGLKELQNMSADYPELIYDGPFSDGTSEKEIKGLSDKKVSKEEAKAIFTKIFNDYKITNIKEKGETEGLFATYNFTAMAGKSEIYAQISMRDGKLIMFNAESRCDNKKVDLDNAMEIGEKFLKDLGVTNMRAVWASEAYGQATINYAYESDDVICYADLIKVIVCEEQGVVVGMEASSYYMNHTSREIPSAKLSAKEAQKMLKTEIDVVTTRLALIPHNFNNEKLAYEFSGDYNGEKYYVYIDAASGKQIEMFKVVSTTSGELLM